MGWIANYPLLTTSVSGSPDQKRYNFETLEDWWDIEHTTFTSAGSGAHTAGKVSTVFYGLDADKDLITLPGTGALAWMSDIGTFETYRSTGWGRVTEQSFSRLRKVGENFVIPNNTWTTLTTWTSTAESGTYDGLNEWYMGYFTAKAAGYYTVSFSAIWEYVTGTQYQKAIAIFKNGVLYSISRLFGASTLRCSKSDIVYLDASDYIEIGAWQISGAYKNILYINLHIQRVS